MSRGGFDGHSISQDLGHRTQLHAAMARMAAAHDGLVVHAGKEMRAQAARIDLFQVESLTRRDAGWPARPSRVHRFPIGAGGERDVVGVLIPALNFEAADPGGDHLGHVVESGKVAGRKQVAGFARGSLFAIHHQVVRQAAGLGALAPIGAAAAPGFGRKALAGIGDAEGAVDEDFEVGLRFLVDNGDFVEGQFPGQGDAVGALGEGELDAFGAGNAGLGGGVKLEIGGDVAGEAENS